MTLLFESDPKMQTSPPSPGVFSLRLVETALTADGGHVQDTVTTEAKLLRERGYDVEIVDIDDPFRPSPDEQDRIDSYIELLEKLPDGRAIFRQPHAMNRWAPLTTRAISLLPLYNPESSTLGLGITEEAFDASLIGGKSANDILRETKNTARARKITDLHTDFVGTEIDSVSRDFYAGSKDAQGVRTRAICASDMAAEHFAQMTPEARTSLVSASLACGAAEPVYRLVASLKDEEGTDFSKIILVDQDPMALATAKALADSYDLEDNLDLQHRNLLDGELTDYIEPHSVDVVDLLGLFEYIPNDGDQRLAAQLLARVKKIVKPGGVILFGNMLNNRPQQQLFSDVVKWPLLQQRSIQEVMDIIEEAGFDLSQVSVRIPAYEGVYAVYGIKIPAEAADEVNTPEPEVRLTPQKMAWVAVNGSA